MNSNGFERAFSNFLDRKEYDEAENALFEMVRSAFKAGWLAAGGNALQPQEILELLQKEYIDSNVAEGNSSK